MAGQTKKCPMCAEVIPIEAAACEYCGAQFQVNITGYCNNCHEVREADESSHCRICGSEVVDRQVESIFIQESAAEPTPLPPAQPIPPSPPPPPSKRSTGLVIAAAGVVLIACIIGVIFLAGGGSLAIPGLFASATPPPTSTPDYTATQQVILNQQATVTARAAQDLRETYGRWPEAFYDTFISNAFGWYSGLYDDQYGSSRQTISSGKYIWEAKAKTSSSFSLKTWGDPRAITDFYLSVDIRQLKGGWGGVIFRRADKDNLYAFLICNSGSYKYAALYKGEWVYLGGGETQAILRSSETNRITVIGEGSHFLSFINDRFIREFNDDKIQSGKVGLIIDLNKNEEALFEFDNYELREP